MDGSSSCNPECFLLLPYTIFNIVQAGKDTCLPILVIVDFNYIICYTEEKEDKTLTERGKKKKGELDS